MLRPPSGSLPPAAERSRGGAAARAHATGHAGPLLQPAGRCARAALAARRVAVIGHRALAPRRPATCHSLRGAELSDVEKDSGCHGSPARDSFTKKLSTSQKESHPRDSLSHWRSSGGKDLGDWDSELGASG